MEKIIVGKEVLIENCYKMKSFSKIYTIIRKYSVLGGIASYFKIPHTRAASIVVGKKSLISLGKAAFVDLPTGRLLISESDTPTKKRFQSTELILDNGARMMCAGDLILYEGVKIRIGKNAKSIFGHHTYLNRSATIDCMQEVTIGDYCAISDNVQILDSDFHTLTHEGKTSESSKLIHIGNHVWIGRSAIILKGITIGDGAIIGAGSIVTKSIPPRCLAVGNPVRVIKENVEWSE